MFERYTEKARRVIFFARYEASQFGQPYIETEHILLGLLREDKGLTNRFLRSIGPLESIRREIEKNTVVREKVSTSVDLPLSNECKRVLAYAAEEAERLAHKHIGTEHLLLGLLREEGCFAQQMLIERGVEIGKVRDELARHGMEAEAGGGVGAAPKPEAFRASGLYADLTQKAIDGQLEPVVGRDRELESIIEVLCRSGRRNPMLLGERGVGKTTIVEALAQRIVAGRVPAALAEMRVLEFSTEVLAAWSPNTKYFEDLAKLLGTVADPANLILFVNGLHGMTTRGSQTGQELAGVLRFAIVEAEVRCICATTEEEYKETCARYPGLERMFRPLHVRLLDDGAVLEALKARRQKLEQFHEVKFADEALLCAVQKTGSYLPGKPLPGKALELLDAAGAAVKTSRGAAPTEVVEAKQRIALIAARVASAIANHEFKKAKFYSEEERKERENLAALREKHGLEDHPALTVTRSDVEEVIARWSVYPYSV